MTDQTLSYEDQLEQLGNYGMALADPKLPFNKENNTYVCGCDGCTPNEDFGHLSIVGVISAIGCTCAARRHTHLSSPPRRRAPLPSPAYPPAAAPLRPRRFHS